MTHPLDNTFVRRLVSVLPALALAASAGLTASALSPTAANADSTGDSVPADVAVRTAIDLARTTERLDDTTRRLLVAQSNFSSAQAALADTEQALAENQASMGKVRDRLKKRAVVAYAHRGSLSAGLDVEHVEDLGAAVHYTTAASTVDQDELDGLSKLETALEAERANRAQERDRLSANKQQLEQLHTDLTALEAQQQSLLDRFGAVPVMGDAWLTPEQMAAWFKSTGASANLPSGTTIDDVARMFVEEGADEHVRGDIAFAQSIVETGYFKVDEGNNFSGIGVCDSCTGPGYTFPTARDSVRTQIQLLRNYADPDSRASNLAHPPSSWLYGSDPVKAAQLYDTFFLKGKAPLWNVMGNGNWATSPTYATSVITVFAKMLAYASASPA